MNGLRVLSNKDIDPDFEAIARTLRVARASGPEVRGSVSGSGSVSADVTTAMTATGPDLVWYAETGSATIWKMNGAAWEGGGATVLQIGSPWKMVATGDLNADSNPDLIWEDTVGGTKAVVFMNGPAYGGSVAMMIVIPLQWRVAAAVDINGDSKPDLIVENTATGEHIALYMNGAVYAGSQAPLPKTPLEYRLGAVADVNGDGKADLVFENKLDGTRLVMMLNGPTYTGETRIVGVIPVAWEIGAAGDFNGDGQNDVVLQNMVDGQRRIYFMAGTNLTLNYAVLPNVPTVHRVIGAARFQWNPGGDKRVSDVAGLRAAFANAVPNSRILIAAGTYDVGNTGLDLDGKSNIEIIGAGRGQTIIKAGPSAQFVIALDGAIQNLSVSHLTIQGAAQLAINTHGLSVGFNRVSLSGARFFDLEIKNVAVGISVVNSTLGACNDVQITGNYLDNIQDFMKPDGTTVGSGYGIHNENCHNLRIADNVIRNADRHSIYQAKANQGVGPGSGPIVIEHNLIIDHARTSSLNGIWLTALVVARSANVVVANNVIVNPYHSAMSIDNEAPGDVVWNVTDVRLINNTVLGARDFDIYFSASGPFTVWGNRYYHRDATGLGAPLVAVAGYGHQGSLVEPSALTGTQGTAAAAPYQYTFAMRQSVIQKATTKYNTDPSTWPLANSPFLSTGFEDIAASSSAVYTMASRKLAEVNPLTWARREGPTTFPSSSMIGFGDGRLTALSGGLIYRINLSTLDGTGVAAPGTGPVRGMAVFGDKMYLLSGSCVYEINTSSLASTQIAC